MEKVYEEFAEKIAALAEEGKKSPDEKLKAAAGILFIVASFIITGSEDIIFLCQSIQPIAEGHRQKLSNSLNKFN